MVVRTIYSTPYNNFKAAPGITTLGNVINYDGIIIIMEL